MADKTNTVRKTIRITPREADILSALSSEFGMSETAFIRFLLEQKPADYPEVKKLLHELINEVNHIGVNINQIAHKINAGFGSTKDMENLTAYMRVLIQKTEQVVKQLGDQ